MEEYSTYPDEELLQRLRNGDSNAFTILYKRYWKRLFYVAADKLQDLAAAEEIVQDIFTDLWTRRAILNITGKLSVYLFVALKNKIINQQVKQKRARLFREYAVHHVHGEDYSTLHALAFEELKEQLDKLIARLPEQGRLVFQMSKEQGLSHREIAGEMNITEKAVERRLNRVVKELAANLRQLWSLMAFIAILSGAVSFCQFHG